MSFLRTIEKAIRRSVLRILDGSGRRGPDDRLPAPLPERPRILLIRIDRIGDAIVSTPALQSLRERYPEGKIDVLLGEKNRAVASLLPFIDNVYVLSRRTSEAISTIRALRRNRYHAVVNLHLNRSAGASLAGRLVRGQVVIESLQENAFKGSGDAFDHVVPMTARLLKPFGVQPIDETNEMDHPLCLQLPGESVQRAGRILNDLPIDTEDGDRILINVSTTHASRNWPTEHFIALARRLREEGMIPMICGAPTDSESVNEIANASGAVVVPPLTSYPDFAAVVARADAVVTPDTSTVHLAAALGRPTIALTSSERTARAWRPWSVRHLTVTNKEGMESIRPHGIVWAVRRLLHPEAEQQTARTEIPTRSV